MAQHDHRPTLSSANRSWQILPTGIWILLAGVLVASFLLRRMRLGRYIYAVGANEKATRLCGVNVNRVKLFVYTAGGFFCGVAGLMQYSYIGGIGQPTSAVMYELLVIAAVIIGGASFSGGEGSILGTFDRRVDDHDPLHGRTADGLAKVGAGNGHRGNYHCGGGTGPIPASQGRIESRRIRGTPTTTSQNS